MTVSEAIWWDFMYLVINLEQIFLKIEFD